MGVMQGRCLGLIAACCRQFAAVVLLAFAVANAASAEPKLLEERSSTYNNIYVYKDGAQVLMTFGHNKRLYTETVYDTTDELALPVTYTRFSTVGLAYSSGLDNLLEIGFGGGRTAWYLHRFLPDVPTLRESGFDVIAPRVALERKLSFPFVTLIMTLIAVPFAVTTGKRGAMYGIGIGIVIAISYWVTFSVFAALGTGGVMPPALAAWAPNLLFGVGAVYLLLTVRT